jgi:hypothetical protein
VSVATDEFEEGESFDTGGDDGLEIDSLEELEELEDDDDGDDDFEDDEVIPEIAEDFDDTDDDAGGDDTPASKGDEDADTDDDEDEEEADEDEEDDDEAEESLDVLLAREKVLDEDDIGRDDSREGLIATTPIGAGEFTCRSCFLVKRRAQLADEERMICFDCA